jgi:hypothetical protein
MPKSAVIVSGITVKGPPDMPRSDPVFFLTCDIPGPDQNGTCHNVIQADSGKGRNFAILADMLFTVIEYILPIYFILRLFVQPNEAPEHKPLGITPGTIGIIIRAGIPSHNCSGNQSSIHCFHSGLSFR